MRQQGAPGAYLAGPGVRAIAQPVASPSSPPLSAPAAAPAESSRGLLVFCLFSLYVIWGSTYLAISWALKGFPPFLMGGMRFTLAGAVLYGVLWLRGQGHPGPRQWRAGLVLGVMMLAVGNGSVVYAQQWVASGVAAIVVGSMPLWIALFSGLQGQWPGRAEQVGLAVGFAGLVLLNLKGNLQAHPLALAGLVLSPASWAFASLWMRRLPTAPGLQGTAVQMLCGGLVLLGVALVRGERLEAMPGPRALGAFFYLLVFGSLIAFSAYTWLLRNARPAVATSYAYINPAVAVLLGVALGGESLSALSLVAMAAILSAVVLIVGRGAARRG